MDLFTFIGSMMAGATGLFMDIVGPYFYLIATAFVIHSVYRFVLAPIFGGASLVFDIGSDNNRNYRNYGNYRYYGNYRKNR